MGASLSLGLDGSSITRRCCSEAKFVPGRSGPRRVRVLPSGELYQLVDRQASLRFVWQWGPPVQAPGSTLPPAAPATTSNIRNTPASNAVVSSSSSSKASLSLDDDEPPLLVSLLMGSNNSKERAARCCERHLEDLSVLFAMCDRFGNQRHKVTMCPGFQMLQPENKNSGREKAVVECSALSHIPEDVSIIVIGTQPNFRTPVQQYPRVSLSLRLEQPYTLEDTYIAMDSAPGLDEAVCLGVLLKDPANDSWALHALCLPIPHSLSLPHFLRNQVGVAGYLDDLLSEHSLSSSYSHQNYNTSTGAVSVPATECRPRVGPFNNLEPVAQDDKILQDDKIFAFVHAKMAQKRMFLRTQHVAETTAISSTSPLNKGSGKLIVDAQSRDAQHGGGGEHLLGLEDRKLRTPFQGDRKGDPLGPRSPGLSTSRFVSRSLQKRLRDRDFSSKKSRPLPATGTGSHVGAAPPGSFPGTGSRGTGSMSTPLSHIAEESLSVSHIESVVDDKRAYSNSEGIGIVDEEHSSSSPKRSVKKIQIKPSGSSHRFSVPAPLALSSPKGGGGGGGGLRNFPNSSNNTHKTRAINRSRTQSAVGLERLPPPSEVFGSPSPAIVPGSLGLDEVIVSPPGHGSGCSSPPVGNKSTSPKWKSSKINPLLVQMEPGLPNHELDLAPVVLT